MLSSSSSITTSFLGALQASVAVLLTIGYGVIASQYKILSRSSARDISKLCVRLFLPALLITNVGSQLHLDTVGRYVPILIWSLIYTLLSIGLGLATTRWFNFPSWVTPALAFNNTTSLPLLLIQSLDATGVLSSLLMGDDDSSKEAVQRAKSYFLVCAIVGNSLTFALGPKLLDCEETPDPKEDDDKTAESDDRDDRPTEDAEAGRHHQASEEEAHEQTSLLPGSAPNHAQKISKSLNRRTDYLFSRLPPAIQSALLFLHSFLNAPLIGALVGLVFGLVPPLHRLFFNSPTEGGYFKAWLTTSISNVGDLFAALQLVVVGTKLSSSLRKMKRGEDSGEVKWSPMIFVFVVRFLIWPLISIPVIYLVATRTSLLGPRPDPMLWFCLMLMPTGPPAIKLTALADVNGSEEGEKLAVAKFLTIAYAVSPIICVAVVGSLKASELAAR